MTFKQHLISKLMKDYMFLLTISRDVIHMSFLLLLDIDLSTLHLVKCPHPPYPNKKAVSKNKF
jgi:hypothetical protein